MFLKVDSHAFYWPRTNKTFSRRSSIIRSNRMNVRTCVGDYNVEQITLPKIVSDGKKNTLWDKKVNLPLGLNKSKRLRGPIESVQNW